MCSGGGQFTEGWPRPNYSTSSDLLHADIYVYTNFPFHSLAQVASNPCRNLEWVDRWSEWLQRSDQKSLWLQGCLRDGKLFPNHFTWVTAHLTATGNCFVWFCFALRTELSTDHEVTSYWLRLREGRTLWSNSCYCSWGLVGVWRTEAAFMETSFLQRKFIIGMIQLPS